MSSRTRHLVAAMTAAGCMACQLGDGFTGAPESHVRDSAGIRIVENPICQRGGRRGRVK